MQLVWLRNDLRIEDNPALFYARKLSECCCVFVITPKQWEQHNDASIKLNLIRRRLKALNAELAELHIPLKTLYCNDYQEIPEALLKLAKTIKCTTLWFNREYPLNESIRDKAVETTLATQGIDSKSFHGDLFHPPGTIKTHNNTVYHVFTPFARQWKKQLTDALINPLPKPKKQRETAIKSHNTEKLWLADDKNQREDLWPETTKAIQLKLNQFMSNAALDYKALRDFPSITGTSTLSPYLSCGAISARQCLLALRHKTGEWLESAWLNELIWREFYRHLTSAYPHLSQSENFKVLTTPIPWVNDSRQWQAWCTGQTGYPIVDAAMKQLLQTGWMHNRLRMIVAAFLTKLLLVDWRKGERFFMRHLVDGDYASNNGGWQWAASTGADAAPYFRIFNPLRQSERFDPEGRFIKKFLPELADLDKKSIHNPNTKQRKACNYPKPIIDYTFARKRALTEYATVMGKTNKPCT